jgi:hypothetical protein
LQLMRCLSRPALAYAYTNSYSTVVPTNSQRIHPSPPVSHHLVLVGGGHAHVQVIKALAARPAHVRVTLIDTQTRASYSGMIPGALSGRRRYSSVFLPLEDLAHWAGVDFIQDRVVDIDLERKLVYLDKNTNQPLPFHVISIDIGSTSRDLDTVPGASAYTIPTRPIHKLVQRLDEARARLIQESRVQPVSSPVQLVVIGGGAAGCELAMAISYRWRQELAPSSILFSCLILDADDTDSLLPNESAQDFAPPLDRRSTGMQDPRNHFQSYCSQTKQRQREPGNDTYSVHALCLGHGSWIARLGTTFASNAGFSLH